MNDDSFTLPFMERIECSLHRTKDIDRKRATEPTRKILSVKPSVYKGAGKEVTTFFR